MDSLKKTLLLVLALLIAAGLFYGCGKRPEAIEAEFAEMIGAEKVTPEGMSEAAEYMEKYLHKLDREKAGHMLVAYEEFATRYINTDSDQTQVQSLLPFADGKTGLITVDKIKKDEKAKAYFDRLTGSYVRVCSYEGKIALQVDYERLGDEFGGDVLPAVRDLYGIKAVINKKPATVNATLQITYEELLRRAAAVEALILDNREEELIAEDARWLYSSYLNMILAGTTNSPVFSYETGEFSEKARAAYSNFVKENPDLTLTWAISEYFRYLNQIDFTMNYKDSEMSKAFFDNCARIVSETEKRVYQTDGTEADGTDN